MGVATLRAAVLPSPWRVLPLGILLLNLPSSSLVGLPIFLLDVPITSLVGLLSPEGIGFLIVTSARQLLLGIGWTLLSYALWSGLGEGLRRPRSVR